MAPGKPFRGWYQKNGTTYTKVSDDIDCEALITGNTTYVADTDWSITYNANGGILASNPPTYNRQTDAFTLNNPTRNGYIFAGWTGSNGTALQKNVSITKGNFGNKTYNASWYNILTITTIRTSSSSSDNNTIPVWKIESYSPSNKITPIDTVNISAQGELNSGTWDIAYVPGGTIVFYSASTLFGYNSRNLHFASKNGTLKVPQNASGNATVFMNGYSGYSSDRDTRICTQEAGGIQGCVSGWAYQSWDTNLSGHLQYDYDGDTTVFQDGVNP